MTVHVTSKTLDAKITTALENVGMALGMALPILLAHPVKGTADAETVCDHLTDIAGRAENNGNSSVALILAGIAAGIGAMYAVPIPEDMQRLDS